MLDLSLVCFDVAIYALPYILEFGGNKSRDNSWTIAQLAYVNNFFRATRLFRMAHLVNDACVIICLTTFLCAAYRCLAYHSLCHCVFLLSKPFQFCVPQRHSLFSGGGDARKDATKRVEVSAFRVLFENFAGWDACFLKEMEGKMHLDFRWRSCRLP